MISNVAFAIAIRRPLLDAPFPDIVVLTAASDAPADFRFPEDLRDARVFVTTLFRTAGVKVIADNVMLTVLLLPVVPSVSIAYTFRVTIVCDDVFSGCGSTVLTVAESPETRRISDIPGYRAVKR